MLEPNEQPLYDPALSYDDNFKLGPFGGFKDPPVYHNQGEPRFDFFGTPVHSPFGIAAGPLPAARFIKAAFARGFDIVTFKSVRTATYPCHPMPNVMPVALDRLDPARTDDPVTAINSYEPPLSLSNSFGIPSREPAFWQPEIKQSLALAGPGQALLTAFQGTDRGEGHEAFVEDHVRGVQLLVETGARIIEINLSCPNEGSPQLLCFDTKTTRQIVEAVRAAVPGVKLLVKITYFQDPDHLAEFVAQIGPLVDGITAINTIAARVVDASGRQAYPGGAARAKPGISGHAILPAGLEMTARLHSLRRAHGYGYKIIGVGGVLGPEDFAAYRAAGADIVMSVTGAMWDPDLAIKIKRSKY